MKQLLYVIGLLFLVSGCSITAPNYSPNVQTIQVVKASQAEPVNVAKSSAQSASLNKVSLRGNSMNSPYGDYNSYVETALKKQLSDAGLLDAKSSVVIGIVLTKNDIDTSMSKGHGDIAAKFSVVRSGAKTFEKEIAAHQEWDSSFVGAIAIPNAVNAYPNLVDQLIANLFKDAEFLKAIHKQGN